MDSEFFYTFFWNKFNETVNGDCPLSSQHTSCAPKCIQDSECSSIGGKCCPNLCNQKSCVRPQVGSNTGGSGYKGQSTTIKHFSFEFVC